MDNLLQLTSNPLAICAAVAITTVVAIHLMTAADKNRAKRPPVVGYLVPWLGSAIVMGQDPDTFFRQAREKFGDVFGFQVAGQRHFHVTSASGIAAVYKNAKSFLFMPTRLHYCHLIFDLSKEAVYSGGLESAVFPTHHRMLAGVNVEPIVKALGTYGLQHINELHEIFDPLGEHTTMESLIHQVSFRAISSAFFGPLFPAKKAYEPFLTFDKSFFLIAAGVPKIFLRKAIQARNDIIDMFAQYLENPDWELETSELTREMISSARSADLFSPRDCAATLLMDFWASEGNLTWGLFWALNIPLHEKDGLAALYAEVDAACSNSNSATLVDFLVSAPLPLVQSTITETLRFTSSSFSIRTVVDDGANVGEYEFRKGDILICNTRAVHLDENVYGEDVTTFRGDRFLDWTAGKRAWLPFGGGISQCEGRHFALKGCKVLIALFLLEFDIRLDPDRPSTIDFDMSRVGGGILHPTKPTPIIVTRRKRS